MRRLSTIDPADYVGVIGATFAKHEHALLIASGQIRVTRLDLARYGVPHTVAALMLGRVLAELRVKTYAGLAEQAHVIGRYKGCGVTVYWLVLVLLQAHGYSVKTVHGDEVTYLTLKARARKAQQDQKKRKPRRAGPPSESASVH